MTKLTPASCGSTGYDRGPWRELELDMGIYYYRVLSLF